MSYDLRIAVKVEGAKDFFVVIETPKDDSPTYNLGQMFRACTGWDFEQGKYYKVSEVYSKIERGIYELEFNADKYLTLNPKNGWGNTQSALETLKSLKECIDNIADPESWYGWNTVPKEYMYVAW